ncbi:hypothetical protein VC83_00812 [Pseudogymnoascus destructans]|uniref:Uncharacterized protein n=1 Tax=Pseudogymnoascus destructans TaxID=655981 RepID=A0A177AKR0_9PEZI|nr:uncharacterized protein VC83_00812 [Pseudogymnoascus destructans]OAF62646.1 hypothetical protein VC83_00812 [Pseudogymnoascus destructans]
MILNIRHVPTAMPTTKRFFYRLFDGGSTDKSSECHFHFHASHSTTLPYTSSTSSPPSSFPLLCRPLRAPLYLQPTPADSWMQDPLGQVFSPKPYGAVHSFKIGTQDSSF